jgi:hypothetical protein
MRLADPYNSMVTRDFKYLIGDQCPEGSEFIQALGMWDNFRGVDDQASSSAIAGE